MKKILLSLLISMLGLAGFSFAQSLDQDPPDSFLVEVSSSIIQPNQPVNVTITAYKNGSVYKDYAGLVWLEISELSPNEYVVSASSQGIGRYSFTPEDFGKKTFHGGLEIKRVGEFTLKVSDFSNTAFGMTKIIVANAQQSTVVSEIDIMSPTPGSIINQSAIEILAYAPDLKGATAQIFLNSNLLQGDYRFDENTGLLSPTISNLKEGQNTLLIRVTNISDVEIGSSNEVTFTYSPMTDNLLKEITANPNKDLRDGDLVSFEMTTDESVSSAVILLTDSQGLTQRFPAEKSADGLFKRDLTMISTGSLSVGAELTAMGLTSTYSGMLSLFVDDSPLISNVVFKLDTQTLNDLTMSWKVLGAEVSNFQVKYGLSQEELIHAAEVDQPSILFQNIDTTKTYYFQIIPLLGNEKSHGTATEVYVYSPSLGTSTTVTSSGTTTTTTGGNVVVDLGTSQSACVVKGIRVTTQKIGGKYYLVWDEVEGATSYTVYMSDANDSFQKRKLLDTQETRYEYPFDYSVTHNVYAYFWVEAMCDDGQVMEITSAKKVQVGPAEDILLLICVSILIYAGIRLYRYTE